jgi:hypothetical protein
LKDYFSSQADRAAVILFLSSSLSLRASAAAARSLIPSSPSPRQSCCTPAQDPAAPPPSSGHYPILVPHGRYFSRQSRLGAKLLRLRSADAAMDMMRRMPLRSTDTTFNTLLQLLSDRSLDLLSLPRSPIPYRPPALGTFLHILCSASGHIARSMPC